MEVKLFDAELKVMDVLWEKGDTPAREIARKLTEELGWNVNTTYTLIKRCINKGAIRRSEPGFDGSADKLFAALLGSNKISAEQIRKLKQIVDELE